MRTDELFYVLHVLSPPFARNHCEPADRVKKREYVSDELMCADLQCTTMGPALFMVLDLTLLINPSKPVA